MRCPFCNQDNTRVVDSRPIEDSNAIRRRRMCDVCGRRFTTYEKVETIPLIVIKKDMNREQYDRSKIETGILRACHKRPVSAEKINEMVNKVETELFNGRDLTGWETYGTEKWYVDKEGNLVCESGPDKQYGYLATREYYDDFDLTLEFKQLSNGNSGVFFRSFVEPPVKVHGWQCEVAPKGHDTAGIYESYGRGWLVQIPDEKESILKEGDWNTLRLKVQGDRVQTWLNGEEMVDITDAKIGAAQGRIALQIHDGGGIKVLWRNLRLTTL